MSDFFERNRPSYYDALTRVRMSNDLIHWVRFFLSGVEQTARKGRNVFRDILNLRTEINEKLTALGKRAQLAHNTMNLLYRKPIVSARDLTQELDITLPTANAMIKLLIEKGILVEITGQMRNRIYVFELYLSKLTN